MKILAGKEVQTVSEKSNLGRLDERGREVVDGRPMQPPLGLKPTPDLMEQIRRMIAVEREMQGSDEPETFEEASDFETGEDTGLEDWEPYFDPTPVEEYIRRQKAGEPLHEKVELDEEGELVPVEGDPESIPPEPPKKAPSGRAKKPV